MNNYEWELESRPQKARGELQTKGKMTKKREIRERKSEKKRGNSVRGGGGGRRRRSEEEEGEEGRDEQP
jgi:hypothetical protein